MAKEIDIFPARKIGSKNRERFYKKMADLLDNGVRIENAIGKEIRRAKRRSSSAGLARILDQVIGQVQRGKDIGDALSKWIPRAESMIITSGDEAGNLPRALRMAAEVAAANREIKSTIRSALTPPAINFAVLIGVMVTLGGYVIPKFSAMLSPSRWTGAAHQLYVFSLMVRTPWFYGAILLFVLLAVIIGYLMPYWTGRTRRQLDRYAPWSLYRLKEGAAWLITIGALIKSGMQLSGALNEVHRHSQPWLAERTARTILGIEAGANLGEALARAGGGFPDADIVDDLVEYANLPDFGERLYSIGREWLKDALENIKKKAAVMRQVLMLAFGAVMIWFAIGTIALQNSIGSAGISLGAHIH